jgi:hypothetical protein
LFGRFQVVLDEVLDVGFGLWVDIGASGSAFEKRSGDTRVFGKIFDGVAIDFSVCKGADRVDKGGFERALIELGKGVFAEVVELALLLECKQQTVYGSSLGLGKWKVCDTRTFAKRYVSLSSGICFGRRCHDDEACRCSVKEGVDGD